jgi:sec-independent protein translocase protein TatB
MFDIAFSEIALIAVVALVVIGPERLPKVARTMGHMMGRLQRYVSEVKADINREIELEELRKLKTEVQTAATDIERSMTQAASEMQGSVRAMESEIASAVGDVTADVTTPPAASVEQQLAAADTAGATPQATPATDVPASAGPAADAPIPPRQSSLPL